MLLQGILVHGKEWKPRPGKRDRRERTDEEREAWVAEHPWRVHRAQFSAAEWASLNREYTQESRFEAIEEPDTPAPEIPPYALAAVLTLGQGDRTLGLEALREHPACRFWERLEIDRPPSMQLLATQRQIEERFKAAWLAAFFADDPGQR